MRALIGTLKWTLYKLLIKEGPEINPGAICIFRMHILFCEKLALGLAIFPQKTKNATKWKISLADEKWLLPRMIYS